jgi:uncharacterized small protein (DUF1192 family)
MFEDDLSVPRPARQAIAVATPPLDTAGVGELEAYVAALRAEIVRAEAAIAARQSHRAAAESFFRLAPE